MTGPVQNEQLTPGIENAAQHHEVNTVGLPPGVKGVKPETQGEIDEELKVAGLKAAGPTILETKLPGQENLSGSQTPQTGHFASETEKFNDSSSWLQKSEVAKQDLIVNALPKKDRDDYHEPIPEQGLDSNDTAHEDKEELPRAA